MTHVTSTPDDPIAGALMEQHAMIHRDEKSDRQPNSGGKGKPHFKPHNKGKMWMRQAHFAEGADEYDEE